MSETIAVWVVDDDPIAVTIVRHLLRNHPELKLTAEFDNGQKLLSHLKQTNTFPSLIILDLNMPMMSGWELLENLQSNGGSNIPVAVITSSIDQRDELRSQQYPEVIGHFVKPMSRSSLDAIAERLKAHQSG